MRPSLPARSSKARATAVMASTPPSRSYREPSTVPTSCALVTHGPTAFPASHIPKPCNPGQVDLYPLLTRRTAGPGRRVGYGSSNRAFEAENNHVSSEEYAPDASRHDPWDRRRHVRHKPGQFGAWLRTVAGRLHPAAGPPPQAQRERHAGRCAIGGQSVRLSANSPRPERRSTDGQMILTVAPADRKPELDLLVCGAPLRNRTVDLLLTMETLCRLS